MFASLRSRLWLSYALLIVTALGVVAMILFLHLLRNPFLYRQTLERLQAVQLMITDREHMLQTQSLSDSAERVSSIFNVRVLQYSQDRQVLVDVYSGEKPALRFPQRRILSRAIPLIRDEKGEAWLYSLEKLPDNTYLMLAVPRPRVSAVNVFKDEFLPLILQGGLIGLVLSLILAFIFARWVADPLQKIIHAVSGMPATEARPVEVSGPHEVRELTRAFNAMVTRQQNSQQSQRDFVANVSHELKTPLTSIQGFSQSILDGTANSPDQLKQAAQVIYEESARMYRMVLDLLDLAKLDAGIAGMTMASVNIGALLNAITERFSPQAKLASVQIKLEVQSDLPSILGDGDRLSQVFMNLVDNALKFTPRGGLISLRASMLNGWIYTTVTDTGAGIPLEALDHVFERFYQADRARRGGKKHGAGLGLVIAREIVLVHGGRISVHSQPGEGTTFEVFLPLLNDPKTTIVKRK